MCLVFRIIVLLSLNWWIVSVAAQEKQDVIITGTTVAPQTSPATQAQQPPQENKTEKEEKKPAEEKKELISPSAEIKKEDVKIEVKKEIVSPSPDGKKEAQTPIEIKKEEPKVEEAKKEIAPSAEIKKEGEKSVEVKKEGAHPSVEIKKEEIKIEEKKEPTSPVETKKEEQKPTAVAKESVQPSPESKKEIALPSAQVKKEEKKSVESKKEETKKEEKSKTLEAEEAEIKGIDTVDLEEPRGNWLFKRIWWNRAENKYEKIRALFSNILEARILFFTKRSTADKELFAPFYFEIGMSNGELQETVSQLLKHIEKERKQEGNLSAPAQEILNVLMREKKSLESINADVLTIHKLDADIDATLKKLMDQINDARKYEREAWNNFKDIAHVLSDKKARELFYQMDTAHNNLKDIQEYVGQALSVHLDRVVSLAKSQIERIKLTIDKLKKDGHDLKTLADQISGKIPTKPTPVIEEEPEPESEEEEQGFFARTFSAIKSGVVGIWDSIVYVVTWPFSWFSSSESSESNEQGAIDEESALEIEEEEK